MKLLFSFFGRTGRGGHWLTALISLAVSLIAFLIDEANFGEMLSFVGPDGTPIPLDQMPPDDAVPVFNVPALQAHLVGLVLATWVYLAGSIKRAHDRGKSGWWVLISFIPVVGFIWWLIDLGIFEGEQGPNRYGPDPRGLRRDWDHPFNENKPCSCPRAIADTSETNFAHGGIVNHSLGDEASMPFFVESDTSPTRAAAVTGRACSASPLLC